MSYRKQYFKNNKSKYRQTVMNNVKKKKRNDLYTLPKESQYNNFLEIIYDNVRGMLPQNIIDMFCNETITIEVLKEGKANAFLEKKDDTYKVCMTQNLDDLLYWSCRIFSYYPDIMSMEEITSRFLDCLWMLQETGQLKPYCLNNLYGNRYDPTSSIGAVMFYFLHEIGHLMIELNGDMVENSIQNELLADLYAVQIFLGEYSDISLPIEVVYQYIQFSLYTFYAKDMLEDHQALDHPEVEMRIENIDRYILEKYPNYLTILHNIKNPIKEFYSSIAQMVETEVYANRQLNIVQNKNKRFSEIYSIIDKSARNRLVPDYMEMLSLTYSIYEDMEYFIMIPELIELNKEAESNMQQVAEIGARLNQDNIEKLNNLYDKAKEINKKLMKSKNDDDRRVLEQELNELHEKAEAIRFTDEEILIQQEMDYLIRKTKLIISYLDKIPEEYKEMLI